VGVKIMVYRRPDEIGHLYLYVLKNDLHEEPFGFIEDVFVNERHRGNDHGKTLVKEAIGRAKARGCYKLILNTRSDRLVAWYEDFGFTQRGAELRMDL